ncbi:MAG: hypothetical protein DRH57_06225 [Candidatus Cloacimonadota bacterium]|nr:MAG: hypothetical protein DRH57_06225 [Candidatus Cloacimonadota bacterium]
MYPVGDTVWAIIHFSDIPKKVIINDIYMRDPQTIYEVPTYIVQYKSRTFEVVNQDIYPTQMDAEIYWALLIKQDHEYTKRNKDLFATDDYEIANRKADIIIQKYADQAPHLLLKYF